MTPFSLHFKNKIIMRAYIVLKVQPCSVVLKLNTMVNLYELRSMHKSCPLFLMICKRQVKLLTLDDMQLQMALKTSRILWLSVY